MDQSTCPVVVLLVVVGRGFASLVISAIVLVAFMKLVFAPFLMGVTPIVLDVVDDHWLGDIIGLALTLEFFWELGLALLGPTGGPVVAIATVAVGTTRVVVPLILVALQHLLKSLLVAS